MKMALAERQTTSAGRFTEINICGKTAQTIPDPPNQINILILIFLKAEEASFPSCITSTTPENPTTAIASSA